MSYTFGFLVRHNLCLTFFYFFYIKMYFVLYLVLSLKGKKDITINYH